MFYLSFPCCLGTLHTHTHTLNKMYCFTAHLHCVGFILNLGWFYCWNILFQFLLRQYYALHHFYFSFIVYPVFNGNPSNTCSVQIHLNILSKFGSLFISLAWVTNNTNQHQTINVWEIVLKRLHPRINNSNRLKIYVQNSIQKKNKKKMSNKQRGKRCCKYSKFISLNSLYAYVRTYIQHELYINCRPSFMIK